MRGLPARLHRHRTGERPVHRGDPARAPLVTGPRAVVFDLDNTLVLEDAATFAALRAAAATAGDGTEALTNAVAETADDLWKRSAVFTDAHAFGIWWGEALWGGFTGDDPGQRAMRAFVPEVRRRGWRGMLVPPPPSVAPGSRPGWPTITPHPPTGGRSLP